MQDRIYRIVEIFLHRTAGPYIRVKSAALDVCQSLPVFLDKRTFSAAGDMSQTANSGHS
jgi:hypothetical protein